jgi:hypothetical protein
MNIAGICGCPSNNMFFLAQWNILFFMEVGGTAIFRVTDDFYLMKGGVGLYILQGLREVVT